MMGARAGRQPNGMIMLDNGTLWAPQGNLPQFGNPLNPSQAVPAPSAQPVALVPGRDPLGIASTPPVEAMSTSGMLGSLGTDRIQPKFFDPTGTGSRIIAGLGAFATNLSAMRGNQGAQQRLSDEAAQTRQQQIEQRQAAYQQAILERQRENDMRPQVVNLGNGGVATADPAGNFHMIHEPERQDPAHPLIRLMRDMGLDPQSVQGQAFIRQNLPSFRYSDEAVRADTERRTAPTFRDLHPRAPAPRAAPHPPSGFILDN